MEPLFLHDFHVSLGGAFGVVNEAEVVRHYGDALAEHAALCQAAALLDLSFRGRVCLTGHDRIRFLNGQVTNNVKGLLPGRGCYAALVTAKGKMECDLHVHCLADELLLDFEPGLTRRVVERLERYIVADDVAVVDVRPHFGLLSVQGPRAATAVDALRLVARLPDKPMDSVSASIEGIGDCVLVCNARLGTNGFDVFLPVGALATVADRLLAAVRTVGGGPAGWDAMELARIEAGIPRFGQDMDETNLPLEAGLEARAVSYTKGCYIGQEVINRIHSIGQVTKALRGLRLDPSLPALPERGAKLLHEGKEVGYVTSALRSPTLEAPVALGYVRKEVNPPGAVLTLVSTGRETEARIVPLPFVGRE
jgi:folate-binding protein YgfZ